MKRREFLQYSLLAASGLFLPIQTTTFTTNTVTIPPHSRPLLRRNPGITIAALFAQFVVAVGSAIVADLVLDWIDGLKDDDRRQEADRVYIEYRKMIEWGFTDSSLSRVSVTESGIYSFPMIGKDGFNACSPFMDKDIFSKGLLEGPTMAGLGVSADDYYYYRRDNSVSEGDAHRETDDLLTPQGEIRVPRHQSFEQDYDEPFEYESQVGVVSIDYQRISQEPEPIVGRVDVVVTPFNRRKSKISFEPFEIEYLPNDTLESV